jgi:hypothetical protein
MMLMKTDAVIYPQTPTPQEPARHVSGIFLARNHMNARDRACLAAGIVDERVKIRNLTVAQVARLCRVSAPYVAAARSRAKPESLAEHFARSTPDEWRECARAIGPAKIWDSMITPLI